MVAMVVAVMVAMLALMIRHLAQEALIHSGKDNSMLTLDLTLVMLEK